MNAEKVLDRIVCGCGDFFEPVVVIAAHPDDEVIGMGARLRRMRNAVLVYVTEGAPKNYDYALSAGYPSRQAYSRARMREAGESLELAHLSKECCISMGFVDQDLSFNLVNLVSRIKEVLDVVKPLAVFSHSYEGGHPDHDSVSFAVSCCLKKSCGKPPFHFEFTSYHNNNGEMLTGKFLKGRSGAFRRYVLNREEVERKERMKECFLSQKDVLERFGTECEEYREAPSYHFSRPPHAGPLFYEMFDWGVTGRQWRALADDAGRLLKLKG